MQPAQEIHSLRDDRLARAPLEIAVQPGPGLISAPIEAGPVGDVADIVVGQLEDEGVSERRTSLDLLAQRREELAGDAHDRHVADSHGLDPGLARFALPRRDLPAHGAEGLDRRSRPRGVLDPRVAVGRDGPLIRVFVEMPDLDGDLLPYRDDFVHRARLGGIEGPGDRLPDAIGGLDRRHSDVMRRTGRSLEEEEGAASFFLELLGGQAVERRRSHAGLLRADRMGRMVEQGRFQAPIGPTEGQDGQLRVEGAGRPQGVVERANPVDGAIAEP